MKFRQRERDTQTQKRLEQFAEVKRVGESEPHSEARGH